MDYQQYLDEYVSYEPVLARRCWAAFLDYGMYFVLVFMYGYFFGEVTDWGIEQGTFNYNVKPGFFGPVAIWIIYFPMLEAIFGYTLFKGLLDLKVVRERKNDFPFFVTFKRHLVDLIDFMFFGLVAILLVKLTKDHKRIGDFLAHSRVVRDAASTTEVRPNQRLNPTVNAERESNAITQQD